MRFRRGLSRRQWKAIRRGLAGDRDQTNTLCYAIPQRTGGTMLGCHYYFSGGFDHSPANGRRKCCLPYLLGKPRASLSEVAEMAEKPPTSTSNTAPGAADEGTALANRASSPEISTALSASAAGATKAPPPTGRVAHVDSTESRDTRKRSATLRHRRHFPPTSDTRSPLGQLPRPNKALMRPRARPVNGD